MYKFDPKNSTTNENVNIMFISTVTLTSDSDAALLNIRTASQGSAICVKLFSGNGSMSLAVRKRFLR